MAAQKILRKRDWLNGLAVPDGGSLRLHIDDNPDWQGDMDFDACLTIRDCSRQVELNFQCYNKKQIRQRLKKVKLMRDYLDILQSKLEGQL